MEARRESLADPWQTPDFPNLRLVDDEDEDVQAFLRAARERNRRKLSEKRAERRAEREKISGSLGQDFREYAEQWWSRFQRMYLEDAALRYCWRCDEYQYRTGLCRKPHHLRERPYDGAACKEFRALEGRDCVHPFVRYAQYKAGRYDIQQLNGRPLHEGIWRIECHLIEVGCLNIEDKGPDGWSLGTQYERDALDWVEASGVDLLPYRWFVWDGTPGFRQVDGLEKARDGSVVLYEVKRAGCWEAYSAVSEWYRPLTRAYFGAPVRVCLVSPFADWCGSCPARGFCRKNMQLQDRLTTDWGAVQHAVEDGPE